ncbi:Proteinase inhibitor I12, Bowman-Birk [Trema orientale]|uniref:Proteinase inhibitor I12, Bowman-Birk n=1 Tax=Trema orientale TaxID=63057 RepID=A0A2P5E2X7_TREOI|nr:Proteinase inhibitor I12, Bowman-Birk [Trema orientale]
MPAFQKASVLKVVLLLLLVVATTNATIDPRLKPYRVVHPKNGKPEPDCDLFQSCCDNCQCKRLASGKNQCLCEEYRIGNCNASCKSCICLPTSPVYCMCLDTFETCNQKLKCFIAV